MKKKMTVAAAVVETHCWSLFFAWTALLECLDWSSVLWIVVILLASLDLYLFLPAVTPNW